MHEQSSRRSRFGRAFITILVVLAAAAGTIAYIVARQVIDGQTVASGTPSPDTSSADDGNGSGDTSRPAKRCPKLTERAAVDAGSPGDLRQLLYIRTAQSEVWICRDRAGKLWYQGHSPRSAQFAAATSDVTLFLSEVRKDGDEYVAVNRGPTSTTTYRISRTQLSIDNPAFTESVTYSED